MTWHGPSKQKSWICEEAVAEARAFRQEVRQRETGICKRTSPSRRFSRWILTLVRRDRRGRSFALVVALAELRIHRRRPD